MQIQSCFRAAIAVGAILLAPVCAFALGSEGHRIVCEIAWRNLTPEAREMVTDIRQGDPYPTFAESCTWADAVRQTTHEHTSAYHFINIPPGLTSVDPDRYCGAPERCVVWAIGHYGAILQDPTVDPGERLEALRFVGHFVGDLHQPLHAGRPGDLGGNTIEVGFLGETRRLHQIWDTDIVVRAGFRWRSDAPRLDSGITAAQRAAWGTPDLGAWTLESYRIDEEFAYGIGNGDTVGQAYYEEAVRVLTLQLQKAGVRLAHVLNRAADLGLAFR